MKPSVYYNEIDLFAEDGDKGQNSKDSSGALHLQSQATLAGWATPDSSHHGAMTPEKVLERIQAYSRGDTKKATNLDDLAVLAGWPTPVASAQSESPESKAARGMSPGLNLEYAARLAGWSTPTVQDAENNAGPSQFDRNSHPLKVQAALAGWITPRSTDIGRERIPENNQRPGGGMAALEDQVLLAGWNTPGASDGEKGGPNQTGGALPHDADICLGTTPASSTVETESTGESRGVLNPIFSLYLMDFPISWAIAGMLSYRNLKRKR